MDIERVVRIEFGSHLYGTNTPESDLDFKAVHLPAARDILLQRAQGSVSVKRPKGEGEKNIAGETDEESYSLQKYLSLLADGQTVAIDMLFAPASSVLYTTPLWNFIRENKDQFLSKKSASFVGYCRTQANKYGIKGSRVAAAKEATECFVGLLAARGPGTKVAEVADVLGGLVGEHTHIVQQVVNRDGDIGTFFECCNRKVDFAATLKQAHEIFSRIYANYGARARLAMDSEGVDWKALSHAVRVGREAIELLTTGRITFPLPYSTHVLAIKKGQLAYPEVAEEIEGLLEQVEDAAARSVLPEKANAAFIDHLVVAQYMRVVNPETA
jgi:hypothetical protein